VNRPVRLSHVNSRRFLPRLSASLSRRGGRPGGETCPFTRFRSYFEPPRKNVSGSCWHRILPSMDRTLLPNPSQQLLEHISSYWLSQIIGVAARLRLPDLLASGPLSSDALAPRVGAHPDGLYRLMRAGVFAGLFTEELPRTFTLTPLGTFLRSEVP
jgi:hypothetical protein